MLTKSTTNVETLDRNHVSVGGHQVSCRWNSYGATVSIDELQSIVNAGHANWSREEIGDIAYHCEVRMEETYSKAYDIVIYEGYNQDQIHVLESIRVADDAAANAYAEQNHDEHEWYVLDADGNNINA